MNKKTNIELFDIAVLYLSDILYQNFPRCIEINMYEEIHKEIFADIKIEEIDKQTLLSETMFFLQENNFINFTTPSSRSYRLEDNPFFGCVRLTAKGLAILKSPPKTITGKESIGSEIKTALRQKSISKLTELGTDLAIKLATNLL